METDLVDISKIKAEREKIRLQLEDLKSQDPFWYFEPSRDVSLEKQEFLRRYLKPEDIPLKLDVQEDVFRSRSNIVAVGGGNGGGKCLTYQTLISTPSGERSIGELYEEGQSFDVYSWNGEMKVITKALPPFRKEGLHKCYRVTMSDGRWIEAADYHRVLTSHGWISIEALSHKVSSNPQESSLGTCRSVRVSNDYRLKKTEAGYRNCYLEDSDPYDAPPRIYQDNDQVSAPLRDDVQQRNVVSYSSGGQEHKYRYNSSIFCGHSSSIGVSPPASRQEVVFLDEDVYTTSQQFQDIHQEFPLILPESFSGSQLNPEVCPDPFSCYEQPLFSPLRIGGNRIISITPVACQEVYDFTVPEYHNYFAGGLIHHNSSLLVMTSLILATGEIPIKLRGVFPEDLLIEETPRECRIIGRTDKILEDVIVPELKRWVPRQYIPGGWDNCWSGKYMRLTLYKGKEEIAHIQLMTNMQDPMVHGGKSLHFVGFDEEPMYEIYKENRMRFRTAKRLHMMFAFTPVKGLTWTKDMFLLQENDTGDDIETFKLSAVQNPANNLGTLDEQFIFMKDRPELYDELKMRLLGEYVSISGLVYGGWFDSRVHVIEPFSVDYHKHLVYRGLDPHMVKATVAVEVAVDREGLEYVCGCYKKDADVQTVKKDLASRALERNYRLGRSVCDKSADSTIKALSDRNIYEELSRGQNAVPALVKSEKYHGSIHAGVDQIKQLLRPESGVPRLYIMNLPENRELINSMKTLERDAWVRADHKGVKDAIAEGRHDMHAALRYIHQIRLNWMPVNEWEPEYADERFV